MKMRRGVRFPKSREGQCKIGQQFDKETKLTGTYYYRADIPEACKRPHDHELL